MACFVESQSCQHLLKHDSLIEHACRNMHAWFNCCIVPLYTWIASLCLYNSYSSIGFCIDVIHYHMQCCMPILHTSALILYQSVLVLLCISAFILNGTKMDTIIACIEDTIVNHQSHN